MALSVQTVPTSSFADQKPGTSGLRKKVKVFQQPNYLENFVQSTFNAVGESVIKGGHLVLGGDGRFFNKHAIEVIIKMCAANGVGKVTVGQNGILSTPAVSAIIRKLNASAGGIILTASHNPGGPENDFGIKYNMTNGGPAPEKITSAIFAQTKTLTEYKICPDLTIDVTKIGSSEFSTTAGTSLQVDVVDCCEIYVGLMKEIFNFDQIESFLKSVKVNIDCLNGVTGPYAKRIFITELKCDPKSVVHSDPLEDFGGLHPDPNLTYAKSLVDVMKKGEHDFGAAFDGDGDRNMILGKNGFFVNPNDSLAVIGANQDSIPYFKGKTGSGFARSMPTGAAIDLVAKKKDKKCFEVPTGWKFFGNLMDAGLINLCGEESFGTGSDHIREKDGIWAALAWLQILACQGADTQSVEKVVRSHWAEYGRNFFTRYDYEEVESSAGAKVMSNVEQQLTSLQGQDFEACGVKYTVSLADNFSYKDPVDGSLTEKQGLRIIMGDGSRIIFRLSGTGSSGATIRLYVDCYSNDTALFDKDSEVLKPLIEIALKISDLVALTGRKEPSVIT